jgi:hypothetical protein
MPTPKPLPHRDVFEKLGETQTRFEFDARDDEVGRAAAAWLAEKQSEREDIAAAKRDAREEETLSIARRAAAASEHANSLARRANSIAITAAIFAAMSRPLLNGGR